MTPVEAVVEEGALVCKHTPAVRGEILAQPWVTQVALAVLLAGEVVAGGDGVELVALAAELAMSLLVELTDDGHFVFLASNISETLVEVNQARSAKLTYVIFLCHMRHMT